MDTGDFPIYLLMALLAVFVGAALLQIFLGLFTSRRHPCPACGNESLRCVQWIRLTVTVDGKRAPDSRSYYECRSCGARFKKGLDENYTVPSEAEWRQYCSPKW